MEPDAARRHLEDERARLRHVREVIAVGVHDGHDDDDGDAEPAHLEQHPADVASDVFEREKDFSILERVEAELRDVEYALRRLDDGTYGRCDACGTDIADERLEAMPATRFCVEHQHLAETGASPD